MIGPSVIQIELNCRPIFDTKGCLIICHFRVLGLIFFLFSEETSQNGEEQKQEEARWSRVDGHNRTNRFRYG